MMNSINSQMTQEQRFSAVSAQYEHHTDEQLVSQIKTYESTSKTYLEKAKRCWAYAKNDKGGHYYHDARVAYEKAAANAEKAEALRGMLAERGHARAFVGNTGSSAFMGDMAVLGAALSAGLTIVECVGSGDSVEETLEKTLVNTSCSYSAIKASSSLGKLAEDGLRLLGASGVLPGAGGLLVGLLVGSVALETGKEVIETIIDGVECGDFWDTADKVTDVVLDRVADAGDNVICAIGDALSWFFAFL